MEYQILTPSDQEYPKRLLDRLGDSSPEKIFYQGPLDFLKRFTMAVISADSISGLALMATNQLLFTIREYDLNIIGGWHSVMETEIFRLGLFRKNFTVTLFTAKGLECENFESFLETRFYPPLHEFPEREEYFRRAKEGKLLMLSVSPPEEEKDETSQYYKQKLVSLRPIRCSFCSLCRKGNQNACVGQASPGCSNSYLYIRS